MSTRHYPDGVLLGRAQIPGHSHPRIVTVRDGELFDITAKGFATVRDIAESGRAAEYVRNAEGVSVGNAESVDDNIEHDRR